MQNFSHFWGCVSDDILTSNRSKFIKIITTSSPEEKWSLCPFKQINAKHELLACSVKLWWSIHPTHRGRPYFPTPFYCFNFGDNIEIFVWCHRQHICHSMKKLWIWWICQSHASCDCHLVIHQASAAAAWARARLLAPWNCLNASCPTPFSSSVQKQHPLESALSKILEPPTRAIQVQVVRLECYNFSHQYIRVDGSWRLPRIPLSH